MFTSRYSSHLAFKEKTAHHPEWIKSGYATNLESTESHELCWIIVSYQSLKASLLSSIPILGSIRGLARLYSVWSVKGTIEQINNTIIHTITGVLEFLGLGAILLVVKIVITVFYILILLLFFLCIISQICFKELFESTLTKSLTNEVRII
ncbi:hypothetical protein O1W69_05065 [Chlamydia sp. 12-01]|uniref:hypothetical protein n=1 Tax=Chlamydia sp. 12-01 TaxID=3002742 RepID=UPI0035D3E66E